MSKLGLLEHGKKREKKTPVAGKVFIRPEKYCEKHGWVDLTYIGGEIAWHKAHAKCEAESEDIHIISLKSQPKLVA